MGGSGVEHRKCSGVGARDLPRVEQAKLNPRT